MNYELHPQAKPHSLYVIHFDDNRIKVGISRQIHRRMAYYKQEARRNRVRGFTWWATAPFARRDVAARAEKVLCRVLANAAIEGHREWIEGGPKDFAEIIRWGEELADTIGVTSGAQAWGRHGPVCESAALQ